MNCTSIEFQRVTFFLYTLENAEKRSYHRFSTVRRRYLKAGSSYFAIRSFPGSGHFLQIVELRRCPTFVNASGLFLGKSLERVVND